MQRDKALPVKLLGPGKIVYISEQMPNGGYVFRAVHSQLRSIEVFQAALALRTVPLEGFFCQSYPFTTCGDTVVYYDSSLAPKCLGCAAAPRRCRRR